VARASNPKHRTQSGLPHTFYLSNITEDIMSKFINLVGQKFGRLTVVSRARNRKAKVVWNCVCFCGACKAVISDSLLSGATKSCGCFQIDIVTSRSITHGMRHTAEYYTWLNMKQRCNNPKTDYYYLYGGRGVTVCDSWLNSFQVFIDDMGVKPTPEYTIERADNNKGYSPCNCYWATKKAQGNNKRNNRNIEFGDEILTLSQWSDITGIKSKTIAARIDNYGWPIERALTERTRHENKLPKKAQE